MCFVRGAAATAALSAKAWNKRTNCLFRSRAGPCSSLCVLCVTGLLLFLSLLDPSSAEHNVAVVKDRSLPGSYSTLGVIKQNACAIPRQCFQRCRCSFVLVADFHMRANRLRWFLDRNPVHGFHFKFRLAQGVVIANNHAIVLRIQRQNIHGLCRSE